MAVASRRAVRRSSNGCSGDHPPRRHRSAAVGSCSPSGGLSPADFGLTVSVILSWKQRPRPQGEVVLRLACMHADRAAGHFFATLDGLAEADWGRDGKAKLTISL